MQFFKINNAHPYYNPHVFNCGYASIDINHDINHIKCFNVDIIEEVNNVSNQLLLLTSLAHFSLHMKHMVGTRWLANPNQGCSHFPH